MKKTLVVIVVVLLAIAGHILWRPDGVTGAMQFFTSQIAEVLYPLPSPLSLDLSHHLIQKTVRNLSQNGPEADSVSANPSDTVEFIIRVSSVGSVDAQNVIVRDALPSGLTYQAGTTTVDAITASDGIISTGINLGTLSPGRTVTIRFRAALAADTFFGVGSTTLTALADIYAPMLGQQDASAQVVVERPEVSATISLSDSTLLSLVIAGIATLIYVGYASSGAFRVRK